MKDVLWELRDIDKTFPGVKALKSVDITIRTGEVHALLGENGSGKSTLIKCIAGVHQPTSGEMYLHGNLVNFQHPQDARLHGVATIFQEFSLVPTLSVAENIFLGRQPRKRGVVDWDTMSQQTAELLSQMDVVIDPETIVRDLSVAEQQLVEIAKALSLESSLLIMDEPTAALGLAETERLIALIRRLTEQGKAILYISHRLDEVFQIGDVVTVLKDGNLVASKPIGELKMENIVEMMVGRDLEQHYPKVHNVQEAVAPILEVQDIHTENGVNGISFEIRPGEVFGLGGMVGAGRTEIARALFGVDPIIAGTVKLNGSAINIESITNAVNKGIGLIPENRKSDGLFFNFDAAPNITMSRLKGLVKRFFISPKEERSTGKQYIDTLSITPTAMERSVRFLSGGNQQKVVIARWLYSQAQLLLLDEPTQGIDVGAKLDVYNVINDLTAQGYAILLISSDYPELIAMSDRIAVIRDGQILHIEDARTMTEYKLLSIASGAGNSDAVASVG